jgi:diaminopimelate decarboxylase/aspartate kinase
MSSAVTAGGVRPFVVLKFGGTSVSSRTNWDQIAHVLRLRIAAGEQPVVVHSAVSGVTDRLEALLAQAMNGDPSAALLDLRERHEQLAADLGVALPSGVDGRLRELEKIAAGVALVREISDHTRARVMGQGELMATELGVAFLQAQGVDAEWVDAREVLRAEQRAGARAKANVLSATCDFSPDARMQARFSAVAGRVYLSQGFIASDEDGHTVLLGRGGSDTSGSYFAAKLAAIRLEIWTDVPGMFSANPRGMPSARLIWSLHYDEAQEIASSGAKVLHPRCLLPVRQYGIPLHVYATQTPEMPGTVISASPAGADAARVKAIALKKGITLVSMESPGMWHQVGFLADAFQVFKQHGLSVDLVSTSETNVTVSLDPQANNLDQSTMDALLSSLADLCRAEVIGPCAALSLVGRNIRGILHKLGDALALFEEQRIHLVSQAANDLNFTLVIDEEQGDRLVSQLHELLIQTTPGDPVMGPTWEDLYKPKAPQAGAQAWWANATAALKLQALAHEHGSAYVYDTATLQAQARALRALQSLDRVHYALKANSNPEVLRVLAAEGMAFECVSRAEVEHVLDAVPGLKATEILFTPNFAPRAEYVWAVGAGVRLTLDNLHPLREWPEVFAGRDLFVRLDPGHGRGHHQHVRTAGTHSKFGVPLFELDELARLATAAGARIVGLHAHVGSGIFATDTWRDTAEQLAAAAVGLPDVRVLDIGGGLGVPDRADRAPVDLAALDATLAVFKAEHPQFQLWMEPGRFLVAQAGVLVAEVTQLKGKGSMQYVGLATGMNSLIRPALYGAWHEIVNLTRLAAAATERYTVVGPICESGDVLGNDRHLPPTFEGDVVLVATAGAYGRVMSSHYNLRPPAVEILI